MANQWLRLYSEFSTDPKVQMLSETNQRRLVMLFCFRCNGHVTLQDSEVTFLLRISNEEWNLTKAIFIEKGFINNDNELLNWDKRQFASDSSAERVARHREKKKQECNVTVTPQNRTEQIQNRTDSEENNNTKEKKSKIRELLHDVTDQTFSDFIELRKTKKAPLTIRAIDDIRKESSKAGIPLETALIECCTRGWTGFKSDWYQKTTIPMKRGSPLASIDRSEFNKQQTAIAKQKLFGNESVEKDVTHG